VINLLPSQYKKYLIEEEHRRLIVILSVLIFLFLISLSLILLSVKTYISGEARNQKILLQVAENEFEASKTQEVEKEIQSINQNLFKLDSFYKSQPQHADLLGKIANTIPQKSHLTMLTLKSLSPEEGVEVFLKGFFPNRELLSEFKGALEEESNFYEVDFPPSNWINPANFSVSFKVHPVK
jgi:Tfp pilus assembly protein PilN